MTGNATPKFTLYVDGLSIMNSSGLFHSYLPLVATAREHYTGHLWYIVNNWNGKTICNNFDFETNKGGQMNFYKCYIAVESWMTISSEDVDYIWAQSAQEAVEEYRKSRGYRKNKKGLTVEEVQYRRVKRTKKSKTQLVSHRQIPYLGGYEYKTYDTVDHYYCSNCGKEVHNDRYCTGCDSELI